MVMVVVMVMVMMIVGADDGYDCVLVTLVDGTGTERNVKSKGQFI